MRRSHGHRPDHAVLVVMLLDDGGQGAGHAHAVAAHDERLLLAVLVHEGGVHGAGVLVAELEHLRDLDAARALELHAALRAAVAGLDGDDIGPLVDLEVLAKLRAHIVVAVLVGADDPLRNRLQAVGRDDESVLGQADRTHGALVQAVSFHVLVGEDGEAAGCASRLLLVHLMIAGDEQHDELALVVLAGKRLHRGGFRDAQELGELGDGVHAGRGHLLHLGHIVDRGARQALSHLVACGITAIAVHERGLAGLGKRMELAGNRAADLAGVGLHGAELKAAAGADTLVGRVHPVVFLLQRLLRIVEAVAVLHDELAAAQQAEARADLVAELRLDLVHVQRQLLVRAQFGAHERGDELLMGGAEAELVVVTVVEAHALGAVRIGTAGLLPEFLGLEHGHADLLGAACVHLLAHDVLDLGQHALAQGQKRVDAGSGLADETGAQQQLMAGDLGIGGVFLERGSIQGAHARDVGVVHLQVLYLFQ